MVTLLAVVAAVALAAGLRAGYHWAPVRRHWRKVRRHLGATLYHLGRAVGALLVATLVVAVIVATLRHSLN